MANPSTVSRPMPYKGKLKNMTAKVLSNTLDHTTTITAYKNMEATPLKVTIAALTTGVFTLNIVSVPFRKGDYLDTIVDTHLSSNGAMPKIIVGVSYEYVKVL